MTEAGPNAGTWVKGSMPREETGRVRLSPAQGDSAGLKLDSVQVRNSERPMSWAGTKSVGANSPGLFMARLGIPGSQEALERRERKIKCPEEIVWFPSCSMPVLLLFSSNWPVFLFKKIFIDLTAFGLGCSMQDLHCGAWAWFPLSLWNLSSPTRDQTHIPCIARWIPNHWTSREVSDQGFFLFFKLVN